MNNKLFKLSDLYWPGVWLMNKIYYPALPIPVRSWFARLRGRFKAFTSEKRFLAKKNLVSIEKGFEGRLARSRREVAERYLSGGR